MKKVSAFEKYAHEYDLVTNAKQRAVYHEKEIDALIDRFHPTHVLDAGCATGLTSVLFARKGIKTVGLDRSRPMLRVARSKYGDLGLPLSFVYGNFEGLSKRLIGKFDLVVCLANSISGVDTVVKLRRTMKNFHTILQPGGSFVLQMLNYKAVTEDVLLPIKATRNGDIVYARYARRQGRRYSVHLVRIDLGKEPIGFEPFTTDFDNFSPVEVVRALRDAGFKDIKRYADLNLKRSFNASGRDLIIVGRRALKA
jgi:SAM-dependent methyltransferase